MQTTLTSNIIKEQSNYFNIITVLDQVNSLFNEVERHLYVDYQKSYFQNQHTALTKEQRNYFKSSYQTKFNINARFYNSIKTNLEARIASIMELNKSYIQDTKENIISIEKNIKVKQKNLAINLSKKQLTKIDKQNIVKLKNKIYYLNQKLIYANKKLCKLLDTEKTANVHLCFGSHKLFNQQFQINSSTNQTKFKSHEDWLKAWKESRNKTFNFIGSSDETTGNTNCQIKYIENNIFELKVNIPKALNLKEKYLTFDIELYNDKKDLVLNSIKNNLSKDKSLHQALTYRFYKDYKTNTYKVFISLDKSKQHNQIITHKLLGSIGIDINYDHLAISEINHHANLMKSFNIPLNLKNKTSNQVKNIISLAVKEITNYAVKVNKPIVIESLDFTNKKKQLKDNYNKKYNEMLNSFAYKKIMEFIQSRCFDKGIELIEINPAYTSKIGKYKYQSLYKLSTHQSASLVIARRGLLSYEKQKLIKDKEGNKKLKIVIIENKEKAISIRRNKYYNFDLPVRNNQKRNNIYWKEIEQNDKKAKQHRLKSKRYKRQLNILEKKNLILSNNSSKILKERETTVVTNHFGVNNSKVHHNFNPEDVEPF